MEFLLNELRIAGCPARHLNFCGSAPDHLPVTRSEGTTGGSATSARACRRGTPSRPAPARHMAGGPGGPGSPGRSRWPSAIGTPVVALGIGGPSFRDQLAPDAQGEATRILALRHPNSQHRLATGIVADHLVQQPRDPHDEVTAQAKSSYGTAPPPGEGRDRREQVSGIFADTGGDRHPLVSGPIPGSP
jgi:hypothetical protein